METLKTGLFSDRIPYIRCGNGTPHLVFFYGGSGLFRSLKEGNVRRHGRLFRKLVPEGYSFTILGYEQNPSQGYDLNRIADDFADVIRDNMGSAVIGGISFGGFVALRFAARHPELTHKLILMITAHAFSPSGERKISRLLDSAREERIQEIYRDFFLLFRRPWWNWFLRLQLWKHREKIHQKLRSISRLAGAMEGMLLRDSRENVKYLKDIRAETLLLGGTGDQFFDIQRYQETVGPIPGARMRLFPGETHMLPVERKKEVAREIKTFLCGR